MEAVVRVFLREHSEQGAVGAGAGRVSVRRSEVKIWGQGDNPAQHVVQLGSREDKGVVHKGK